jgi:hypothetical protein
MVLVLPAMSIAIAISSYALGLIKPIHWTGNNSILMVYLQSYLWMAKLVGAFKDLSPGEALLAQDLWF